MLRRWLPITDWLPNYRREDLPGDLTAGLTGAAILVPQSMAYARIAGLPPVVGLYASVVPILVYAIFGRSRQLSVGPLATISIMGAVALSKLAPTGSSRYIALAATLALLVGLVHLVLGLGRLGFLVRFVAEPVMAGFISAVGLIIISTQLAPLFGITARPRTLFHETVWEWARRLDQTSLVTLALGAAAAAVLLLCRRWPRVPTALMVLVTTTVIVALFDLADHGVAVVGPVPSGLAGPKMPPLGWHDVQVLLPMAIAITFVGFLESIALAREYAARHHYEIDTNHELVALGMSNVSAGLFQGMIVTGAVTRSSILDQAGARTQLSGVIAAAVVAPLLLFGTVTFRDIPLAVLAAIVVVAVLGFLKVGEARRLWRVKRSDFWLMAVSFAATLALGLERGVLLAVAASIVALVYRATRPQIVVLGRQEGSDAFLEMEHHPDLRVFPGTLILRVNASITFVNAEAFEGRIASAVATAPDLHTVVLDASGIDELDATGDHALRRTATRLHERQVALYLVNVNDRVKDVADASGLTAEVGEDHFFATDADAIAHLDGD